MTIDATRKAPAALDVKMCRRLKLWRKYAPRIALPLFVTGSVVQEERAGYGSNPISRNLDQLIEITQQFEESFPWLKPIT